MNTKTKAILAFTAIFLIGFTSGYLISRFHSETDPVYTEQQTERPERQWQQFRGQERVERTERVRQRVQNRLIEQLQLEETQQEEFFERLSEYRSGLRETVRELREEEHDKIRKYYEVFRNEMADILDSSQLSGLDSRLHPDSVRTRQYRSPRQR